MLNKVRVGNIDRNIENIKTNPSYSTEALHIFADNRLARINIETMLDIHFKPFYQIPIYKNLVAENGISKHCSNANVAEARNRSHSETGCPALSLRLKTDARVMITANIDITNRLVNG